MTRFLALVALVVVAASSGCQTFGPVGQSCGYGEPCYVTRSQMAPRPQIMRTACHPVPPCGPGCDTGYCDTGYCDTGCCDSGCCDTGCGCCDTGCCDTGCCDGYCEPDCSCGPVVDCCDICGGDTCGGGCCGICGGCGNCCMCGGGPQWCGFCNRYCGCGGCGSCGGYEQGFVNGCVNGVCGCASGDNVYNFNPGPPVGQTAYPYYTVRGPRDFLNPNPPPLGPY